MTKHLRFLFVMLLAMIWSAGWAAVGDNFKLVTDAKDLKAGDKIIIGSKASKVVLGAPSTEKSNKRAAVSATFSSDGVVAWKEGFDVITLEGSASAWYLHSQAGYLYAKSGKGTTDLFKIDSKADANTSLISIDSDFDAQISFKGVTGNAREIRCNTTTDNKTNVTTVVFGHYVTTTATTTPSQIYKLVNSGETKTDTKVSFSENSGKTFTFTEGEYTNGTFTTPTATETNGVAGTVAYSSSNATAISVDASTGALTFKGYGKATITATFTPNDTEKYVESTDSYIVENNQKVDESVILFSADAESFESIKGTAYDKNIGDFVFVATNGKNYTFNVQRALTDNGRLQLNGSTVTSPSFPDFTNGYKVSVEYTANSKSAEFTLSSGSKSVSGQGQCDKKTLLLDVKDGTAFIITNNKAAYVSKIEIVPNKVGITLDENSESNTIEAKNGVNVTLKRTMVANEWNTICLPFNVSKEKAQIAFGEGVKIAELNAGSTGTTLSFNSVNEISAKKPYLIKPSKENTSNEYVFENVNVVADDINKKYETTEGYLVFKGIYNMMDITKDVVDNVDATYYAAFLGAGNKIYKAGTGKTKGFRAYFAIPNSASASALRVVIDGTATSIKNIDSEVVESNAPVYNLQGQRVDGNNLTPGIYVKAGKKFVVK